MRARPGIMRRTTAAGRRAGVPRRTWRRPLLLFAVLAAACTPTRFEATNDIPQPLIEKIPVVVGVHLPLEFREQVYEEKRESGAQYSIGLGKAQSAGIMRIFEALFLRVVPVPTPADAARVDPEIRGVLEPVLEDYAFVTPMDSGTQAYAATLRYTIRLYSPNGELVDSWTFTGYGSQPGSAFPGKGDAALQAATRQAMRDAAAKLAAEFHEQAIARGLIGPGAQAAPAEVVPPPR